jgi:hypothetical protein
VSPGEAVTCIALSQFGQGIGRTFGEPCFHELCEMSTGPLYNGSNDTRRLPYIQNVTQTAASSISTMTRLVATQLAGRQSALEHPGAVCPAAHQSRRCQHLPGDKASEAIFWVQDLMNDTIHVHHLSTSVESYMFPAQPPSSTAVIWRAIHKVMQGRRQTTTCTLPGLHIATNVKTQTPATCTGGRNLSTFSCEY